MSKTERRVTNSAALGLTQNLLDDMSVSRRAALSGFVGMAGLPSTAAAASDENRGWELVTAHGALGNGRHDDTASIQAAIDRAHERGGGTIVLPRGEYRVNGTLYGKPGVSIAGEGALASRLIKEGAGDCLVYGAGTGDRDADVERVTLHGFSVVGQKGSNRLFWGRKAATAFALRDLYFEGGDRPVVLDKCYSSILENVQIRGARVGDNLSINAISHNVLLLQVAAQVARQGAGISVAGCSSVVIVGGKLEFNAQDQLRVGPGCRGVTILGLYIEGIQPTRTGFAGIRIEDADTVIIHGGFFDASQGTAGGESAGIMGTDGSGTYVKTRGQVSRLVCSGYGFASVAREQVHFDIGEGTSASELTLPLGAAFVNRAPLRNVIRFSGGENGSIGAAQLSPLELRQGVATVLAFTAVTTDPRGEWLSGRDFVPRISGRYGWSGFIQMAEGSAGGRATLVLFDVAAERSLARINRVVPFGSTTIDFDFREWLVEGSRYQIRLTYSGRESLAATSGAPDANRMSIERLG